MARIKLGAERRAEQNAAPWHGLKPDSALDVWFVQYVQCFENGIITERIPRLYCENTLAMATADKRKRKGKR